MKVSPITPVSRFFSMASPRKSVFSRLGSLVSLLVMCILFCISMNTGDLSAGAIDSADMQHLSLDMFRGMLGDTISGQYLGTDGQMHSISFGYNSKNVNNAQTNMYGYTAADWSGYMLNYVAAVPADFYFPAPSSGDHSVLILSPNLHYQNITYFKFGVTWLNTDGAWQSAYNSTPYTNFSPYVYLHAGDTISDTYSLSYRTDNQLGADTWNSQSSSRNPFLAFSDEGSWEDFYLGDIYISPIGPRSSSNQYFYVYFVPPTVNSSYLYAGHGTAPAEPVTTTVTTQTGGSGAIGGGGSVTTDASGATGFVYSASLVMPDYMYSGQITTTTAAAAEGIDSALDDAGAAGDVVASDVSALGDYDTSIIWDGLSALFARHPQIILIITGLSGISLLGWLLNRYGG